ncbi:hypothetical protein PLICRDRAFT_52738 [Plicaturopsis crispa FD-325 SS-3]|nr:hypothetical protein PLICRDRAFT_52738 [Plicaturopsis crispa FD-325 SS-3]
MSTDVNNIARLARVGHAGHCKMCLQGLPASQVDIDASRLALAFYCLGSLDLLATLEEKSTESDRLLWKQWIWEQYTHGKYGSGFRPSSYMTSEATAGKEGYSDFDTPHLIMTYTALLSLSILRDDFSSLDRPGLLRLLRECQEDDGSFSTVPHAGDSDLRTTYCAFVICSLLDDWSGINVDRAVAFIRRCRTYEGAYGQSPFCEAQGGTTYCAIASLHLLPTSLTSYPIFTPAERKNTTRWLVNNQHHSGGFCGRTGKDADACYCFWCGASLQILGVKDMVDVPLLTDFLSRCQFKFGGIAKSPGERPDPYHTYLSCAALSMYPPTGLDGALGKSWAFSALDPLINANEDTARWARRHIPGRRDG